MIDYETKLCVEVQQVFNMKIKFNYDNSSGIEELSLSGKMLKVDYLKTCRNNLIQYMYVDYVQLQPGEEGEIKLYDLTRNKTHDSKEFCIDTQYDANSTESGTFVKICHSFCLDESSTCVPYCCPRERFWKKEGNKSRCAYYQSNNENTDWKPKALKNAGESGIALYRISPKCTEYDIIDSFNTSHPLEVLENGFLDWGMICDFEIESGKVLIEYTFQGGKMWTNEHYCLTQVESQEQSNPRYWQRYIYCRYKNITEGCYEKWKWIDFELIPGLFVVSMICLFMTCILMYSEQKEKLFG